MGVKWALVAQGLYFIHLATPVERKCFFLSPKIHLTFLKQVVGDTAVGKTGEMSAVSGWRLTGVNYLVCVFLSPLPCLGD